MNARGVVKLISKAQLEREYKKYIERMNDSLQDDEIECNEIMNFGEYKAAYSVFEGDGKQC